MSTGPNSLYEYLIILSELETYKTVTPQLAKSLRSFSPLIYRAELQNRFSEPMLWIGHCIALASLLCTLAMVADLLHGLRNKKFWFPCRYFTLNAASLSVIAVAMKLPVDLNNAMPGVVDQHAKLGSMAFMCTIMANLLPSLATMNNKELLTNIIALGVLVITLVVNVCIQINTGLVSYTDVAPEITMDYSFPSWSDYNRWMAKTYVAMLLFLLIILTSSSLMILNFKGILEPKFQACHETASQDQEGISTVKKLKQHVTKYWIMTRTGSPQFLIVCSAMSSASGVICVFSTFMHVIIMLLTYGSFSHHWSDYKWSMLVILITQFIGALVGTIGPLCRCFATVNFKLSNKWIQNHIKVFKVESYWTQKLSDLKQSRIPFRLRSRRCKIVVQNLKLLILKFLIGFQKTIVVTCKTIGLILIFLMIFALYCSHCWKWLKAWVITFGFMLVKVHEQHHSYKNLSHYVLKLQDDMELAERTLKSISKSVDREIHKAEKQQPNNLMKLIEGSSSFEGVEMFDSHHVPPLLAEEPPNCWSLPVVTLTSIAISLPNIQNNMIDSVLNSVSEGLVYVTLVEENLNAKDDHISIHKAAESLWLEVEVYHKWLGNRLQRLDPQVNTAGKILEWFRDTAKSMVLDANGKDIDGPKEEESIPRSICANSMYRITETILLSYQEEINQLTKEQLYERLSSFIGDILAACLTNIPRVIAMKCYASAIEKREASVKAAAQLLGETTQIVNCLQDRELPGLDPEEMAYIDKWRAYSAHPFP